MQALTGNVARMIFAVPFAIFGMMHFMMAGMMAGMVPISGGVIWVYLTGAALILGAAAIMTGKHGRLAALLLAAMVLAFNLTIHIPAVMGGDQMQMSAILRNFSLVGAALTYAGLADNGSAKA